MKHHNVALGTASRGEEEPKKKKKQEVAQSPY